MTDSLPLPLSLRENLRALHDHVGGEATLAKILKDFYARMSRDILIGFFFQGQDLEGIAFRQLAFLLRAMGIAPSYAGKAPAQAHEALPPILRGHFDRRLRILEETLVAHGVAAEDIRTWLRFENAFRDAIVTPESA